MELQQYRVTCMAAALTSAGNIAPQSCAWSYIVQGYLYGPCPSYYSSGTMRVQRFYVEHCSAVLSAKKIMYVMREAQEDAQEARSVTAHTVLLYSTLPFGDAVNLLSSTCVLRVDSRCIVEGRGAHNTFSCHIGVDYMVLPLSI